MPLSLIMEECSICLSEIEASNCKVTECGHYFHKNCLARWYNIGNDSCPNCRHVSKRVYLCNNNNNNNNNNIIYYNINNINYNNINNINYNNINNNNYNNINNNNYNNINNNN